MKKTKLLLALCLAGSLAQAQIISTIVGSGTGGFSGDNGLAQSAKIAGPYGIAFDASGNMYFSDGSNNRIRKVSTTGVITTIAGNGTQGHTGDGGAATSAEIYSYASALAVDASGNVYFADFVSCVRKISTSGVITTVAGSPTSHGFSGDTGPATSALLNEPNGIAFDASGNMYISDGSNYRIRKVNSSGIITTIAGNGTSGHTGDGGAATSAEISGIGISFDGSGNLYLAEYANNYIRKINTSGIISTVAGNGTAGYTGNGGAATSAELNSPNNVTFDAAGNMYIAERLNNCVRVVNTSGIINSFAGNTTYSFGGDGGPATSAEFENLSWVGVDASNNIVIADNGNNRIRKVSSTCPANAGPNVINQQGCCHTWPGVAIGTPAVPNMSYSWSPSTLLTPTNTAQPTSTWTNTTTCEIYTVTVSYSLCTTASSTVQVCAQTFSGSSCCRLAAGIETENQSSVAFTVYPNPASGQATISLYDKATYIQVVDMQGRLVFEGKEIPAGDFKLDISRYNKGVYFISAKLGNTIEKQKLIVE